jgi:NDP-sugar pyrophosphorylase family protein
MLMAAGLGTRLKPFTDMIPKALLPVMGVPVAQFAIDALVEAGVKRIVANVHHQADQARSGLMALDRGASEMILSDESGLLLGSAGGIAKAAEHFEGAPFFLVNADVLSDVSLSRLAQRHLQLRAQCGVKLTLTVFPRPRQTAEAPVKYREIFLGPSGSEDSGLIQGLGDLQSDKPYFVGAAILEPELFKDIATDQPSDFVEKILRPAISEKKAGYYLTEGKWFDIGSAPVWLETHLQLIRDLETGELSRNWRLRLEENNLRIAQQVWISRGARRDFKIAGIAAPAYFNHLGDSTAQPPALLGPDAVLYGDAHSFKGDFSRRIGFRGLIEKV